MRELYAEVSIIAARLRESEHDARRLIARAAHIEKRAERARVDSTERLNLNAVAMELRAAAEELLAEVSESRGVRTDLTVASATRP